MPDRPTTWVKVINPDAETCYWMEPDGTRHPCTEEENREVRRQLLVMRITSDNRRQDESERRGS